MFRTMSLRSPQGSVAPKGAAKNWLRRSAALVTATLVGTTALSATGLSAVAAPVAQPQSVIQETITLDFENGMVDQQGNTWLNAGVADSIQIVADPDNPENNVLQFTQTANWQGLQTPNNLIENGIDHVISANVRWADGESGDIRWVTSNNGNSDFGWVGNRAVTDTWATVAGEFNISLATPIARLVGANGTADHPGTILVDNVTVTRYLPDTTDPGTGDPEGTLVIDSNLTNRDAEGTPSWNYDLMSHGGTVWVEDAQAWQIARQGWGGIFDTNNNGGNHFAMENGATYWFAVEMMAASPEFDGARINLAGHEAGGPVGNGTLSATEWTTISGTIVAGANQMIRATSPDADLQVLVRSARMIRTVDAPPVTEPPVAGGWETVAAIDFENGTLVDTLGNTWRTATGAATVIDFVADPADADNTVLSVTQTADWQGLETPAGLIENGVQYRLSADVRGADGFTGSARFVSSDNGDSGHSWRDSNVSINDAEWSAISTDEFTLSGFTNPLVRVNAGPAGTFLVDNVVVERYVPGEGGGETPQPFTPVMVWSTDFSDNTWSDHLEGAGAAIAVVANPDGEGNVLAVTGRSSAEDSEWQGARIVGLLEPGVEYRFDIRTRLATEENGTVQFRGVWAFAGDRAVTNEWSDISSDVWAANANAEMNIGMAPNGANFFIDSVEVWQLSASPEVDPNWEFPEGGLVWDFENGTTQEWFARNASGNNPVLSVVEGGPAGSSYAIRISERGTQGDGPMIDLAEALAPLQRFEISGYLRWIDRDGGTGPITLSIQTASGTFTNLVTNIQVRNNEWTRFEGEFTTPAFTNMANLYFEAPWAQGAQGDITTFEIDNISIQLPGAIKWERDLIPLSATLPGINTGIAVDTRELVGEHSELLLHHFTKLVGENHMKPDAWFPGGWQAQTGGFNTFRMNTQAIAILDFAAEHNLDVFGHVLLWHSQTPQWFFGQDGVTRPSCIQGNAVVTNWPQPCNAEGADLSNPELTNSPADRAIMMDRMRTFIRLVAEDIADRYGKFGSDTNPVNSYEVANEVVASNIVQGNLAGGLRPDSPWTRIFHVPGQPNSAYEFILEGFRYADQMFNGEFHEGGVRNEDGTWNTVQGADRITLWVNDYNTERGGIGTPDSANTKRVQLLNLVNFLVEQGAPIDGVGHQFHAGLEFDVRGLRDALELFANDNRWLAEFPEGHPRYGKGLLQAITEIDVTINGINPETGVTEAQLIQQGHYYRDAFDIIRTFHARTGEIDTVTIWGLTDGRSWRANQLPLLFSDNLISKPAFHGAVLNHDILTSLPGGGLPEGPGEGGSWTSPPLQTIVEEANVFGATVPMVDATFDAPVWNQLPAQLLGQDAGEFTTRWTPGTLTVLGTINGITSLASGANSPQPFHASIIVDGRILVVHQDGTVTANDWNGPVVTDVTAITRVNEANDTWQYIVQVPTTVGENGTLALNVARRDNSRDNMGAWSQVGNGLLTFVSELGYVEIPQSAVAPTVNAAGLTSSVWENAAQIRAERVVSGPANAAAADVRAVWHTTVLPDGAEFPTLYLLVDVDDTTPDVTSGNAHEQDSVEIFVGLEPHRGGVRDLQDAQFRISRAGVQSFGQGRTEIQAQRITSFVVDNDVDGYQAIIAIDMRTEFGHQAGQWDNGLSGLGYFHNFDVQVNDATPGGRAVIAWAGNDSGFNSTERLGVMQFVAANEPGPTPPFNDVDPNHRFAEAIRWMAENGISAGWEDGTFRPGQLVTRQAMAAFLFNILAPANYVAPAESPFVDVPLNNTHYREIAWLAESGISTGWPLGDGTFEFRPSATIQRDAMALFLYRAASEPAVSGEGDSFIDLPASDHQAYNAMRWLYETEIAEGWPTDAGPEFRPGQYIQRDALAAFLHRAVELKGVFN